MSLPFGIAAVGLPILVGLAFWTTFREDTFGQELEAAIREEARISGGTILNPPPQSQSDQPAHDPWTAISASDNEATKAIGPDQECMMCLQHPTGGHFISSCNPVPHIFCRECLLTWWSTPAEEAHGLKRHCTLCHTPWRWGFDRDETLWHSGLREHRDDPGKVVFGWISTRRPTTADGGPAQPMDEIFRMLGAFNVVTGQVTMYKMDDRRGPGVDHSLPTIVVPFGEFLAALAGRVVSVDIQQGTWTRKIFNEWTFTKAMDLTIAAIKDSMHSNDPNRPIVERNLTLHFRDFAMIRFTKLFRPPLEGSKATDYSQDPPFSIRLIELYIAIHEFLILTHWQRNVATVFTNRSGPAPAGRQITTDACWVKAMRDLEACHGYQARLIVMKAVNLLVQQVDSTIPDVLDMEKCGFVAEPYILGENQEWPRLVYED